MRPISGDVIIDTPSSPAAPYSKLKSGRTSAPRLPQAEQMKRGSMSESVAARLTLPPSHRI
jgi:hypothetical protein